MVQKDSLLCSIKCVQTRGKKGAQSCIHLLLFWWQGAPIILCFVHSHIQNEIRSNSWKKKLSRVYREDVFQLALSGCWLQVPLPPESVNSLTVAVSHYALSARVWAEYMSLCSPLSFFSATDYRLRMCVCFILVIPCLEDLCHENRHTPSPPPSWNSSVSLPYITWLSVACLCVWQRYCGVSPSYKNSFT